MSAGMLPYFTLMELQNLEYAMIIRDDLTYQQALFDFQIVIAPSCLT